MKTEIYSTTEVNHYRGQNAQGFFFSVTIMRVICLIKTFDCRETLGRLTPQWLVITTRPGSRALDPVSTWPLGGQLSLPRHHAQLNARMWGSKKGSPYKDHLIQDASVL